MRSQATEGRGFPPLTTHSRLSPPPSTSSPAVEEIFTTAGRTWMSRTRLVVGEAEMLLLVATQLSLAPWWARLRPERARTLTVLSALLSRETSIIVSSGVSGVLGLGSSVH